MREIQHARPKANALIAVTLAQIKADRTKIVDFFFVAVVRWSLQPCCLTGSYPAL